MKQTRNTNLVALALSICCLFQGSSATSQSQVLVAETYAYRTYPKCLEVLFPDIESPRANHDWKRTVTVMILPPTGAESQIIVEQFFEGQPMLRYKKIQGVSVIEHLIQLSKSLGNLSEDSLGKLPRELEPDQICRTIPTETSYLSREELPELDGLLGDLEATSIPVFESVIFLNVNRYKITIETRTNRILLEWSGFSGSKAHPLVSWIQALEKALERAASQSDSKQLPVPDSASGCEALPNVLPR